MLTQAKFVEMHPGAKDEGYANDVILFLRMNMKSLVDAKYAEEMKSLLYGTYSMGQVEKMFEDPKGTGLRFIPLAVLEKVRNVFIADIEDVGIDLTVNATDVSSVNEKERDRQLLQNRRVIETVLTKEQTSIGGPPFSLAEENKKGEKLFSGNVDKFDEMGLDENSSEDIGYFFSYFHRLGHEIAAEAPINAYLKLNEVDKMVPMVVDDILAFKACAYQSYVSETTGQLTHKYLKPEHVDVVGGKRRDFKDALALGYEENISVTEFLNRIGNHFDYENDLQDLLYAVNFTGKSEYTGICEGETLLCGDRQKPCEWSALINLKVTLGYKEWKSVDASDYKYTDKNHHKNKGLIKAPIGWEPSEKTIYSKKTYYNEVTYKSYYLIRGTASQKLYKFGKLFMQEIEGAEDEYSSFSIRAFKEPGQSFAKVSEPFVELLVKSFKKFEFEVMKAKPRGRSYNYDSILKIAKSMFPTSTNLKFSIEQVMAMFTASENEIHTTPTIDGTVVGGGSSSSFELENGMTKTVMEFKNTIDWCFGMINQMVGIAPIQNVYQPGERDGFNLQQAVLKSSLKATRYIPRMIDSAIVGLGVFTLNTVQTILQFKDKNALAYKHLLRTIGDQHIRTLTAIGKVALHRYSLFVETFNQQFERQEIKAMTNQALMNKEISTEQALLINNIKSPKRAAQILAYEKKRKEDLQQKNIMAIERLRQAGEQQKFSNDYQLEQLKITGGVQKEDTKGRWLFMTAQLTAKSELERQNLKIDVQTASIQAKNEAKLKELEAASDIAAQKPA